MKKITYLLAFFVALATLSCEKEPSRASLPEVEFKVDFDGQTFIADRIAATVLDNVINVSGFRGPNNESIILTISSGSEGVYQLGVANGVILHGAAYAEQNNPTNGAWVALTDGRSSQGTVIISEINEVNKTISGNFSFTGNNPSVGNTASFVREFTNGSFTNVPYESELSNPPGSNNSFSAKVDGVAFEEDLLSGILINSAGISNINIVATKNNVDSIGLTFPVDITPGDYDFTFGVAPIGQYTIFTPFSSNIADGSFTITTHDVSNKRIVGTFSFVAEAFGGGATGSFDITEGSFDVTYE